MQKQNSMQQKPKIFFNHVYLSHFFCRAKYFQGKKVNGEFDIRVEQVSSNWIWLQEMCVDRAEVLITDNLWIFLVLKKGTNES